MTLTGTGGIGKTRLALEIAAQQVDEFPDGVWFFDLAAVADPAAVPDAVAAVLGIVQQPGKSVADSVAAALEGRFRLLVFDNWEHVLAAGAGLVEAILVHAATIKIVATSREGLRVRDTHTLTAASLVATLAVARAGEEARAAANGLIEAANNPDALSNTLRA